MKTLWASALLLMATTPAQADEAIIIIREYRPHCRSRITEITLIPKIEPIGLQAAPQPYKFADTGWQTDKLSLKVYSQWLKGRVWSDPVLDRRDNVNP